MDLDDRVVLITGASSGIGMETARLLASRGAKLVLGARREDRLQRLVDDVGSARAVAVPTDVTDAEAVRRLVERGLTEFGALDVVFANAGFGGGGTLVDGDPDHWRSMLLTNVYGAALTVHYAIEALLASDEGHVVLTSSVAGTTVHPSRNHMYSATKFAVEALGEGLRKETTGRLRVTLVEPGAVDTEFFDWPGNVLAAQDVARAVVYALEQPRTVAVNNLMLRPITQEM